MLKKLSLIFSAMINKKYKLIFENRSCKKGRFFVLYKIFFQTTSLNEPSVEANEVATTTIQNQLYTIS